VNTAGRLVLARQRHLKWRALDWLERALMIGGGLALAGFSITVCADIVTRTAGRCHPKRSTPFSRLRFARPLQVSPKESPSWY